MKILKWLVVPVLILVAGCSAKTNDGITAPQPSYTGTYPNPLVIYNSGTVAAGLILGDLFLNPPSPPVTGEGVTISFNDTSVTPISGTSNLLYGVLSYGTGWQYIQFPFPVTNNPVDLRSGGFTKVTFWTKGNQTANTQFYGASTTGTYFNSTISVTPNWQAVTFTFSGPISAVNNLFTVGIESATLPALVYVDNIQYQ